jgi:hypothetical protein
MTSDLYQELTPSKRRRSIYGALLRGLLTATVLVDLYYDLHYDLPDRSWNAIRRCGSWQANLPTDRRRDPEPSSQQGDAACERRCLA